MNGKQKSVARLDVVTGRAVEKVVDGDPKGANVEAGAFFDGEDLDLMVLRGICGIDGITSENLIGAVMASADLFFYM